jgi:nucleotide-binding universal stress UspA family protein
VEPPWERQLTYLPPARVIEQLRQQTGASPDRGPSEVDHGCKVESATRIGDPFDKINAYAEEIHADLIVMAGKR